MKYVLIFWGLPMGLFWGWYYLSYHDMHFGYLMLSRMLHDHVFEVYGRILGVEPSSIMPLVTRACIIDTALIFAIFGFRRRRQIRNWFVNRTDRHPLPAAAPATGRERPAG